MEMLEIKSSEITKSEITWYLWMIDNTVDPSLAASYAKGLIEKIRTEAEYSAVDQVIWRGIAYGNVPSTSQALQIKNDGRQYSRLHKGTTDSLSLE